MSGAESTLVVVAPEPEGRLGFADRVVDRLNPILVREVQQSLNGKAFLSTLVLALMGVVLVGLTSSGRNSPGVTGYATFRLALQLLAPIVLLAVPMVAFLSMRQEVSAGTIEHLLLSKLGPGAIVRGKLYAALVQQVIFLAVFAPLVAMTFLLRGVDVPTILQMLGLAAIGGLVACSLAIAMGALSRFQQVRALPLLVVAAGLTIVCVAVVGAMDGILYWVTSITSQSRGGRSEFTPLAVIWIPCAVAVLLFGVTAAAALAHPNENRSTVFRLFAVGTLLSVFGWVWWMDVRWRSMRFGSSSDLDEAAPALAAWLAGILYLFWYFAVTEAGPLSLRVRTRVPRNRVLAGFLTPWLPGGGRGYLFMVLLALLSIGLARYLPLLVAGIEPDEREFRTAVGVWGYVLVFAGLLAFIRRRLPQTSRASVSLRLLGIPGVVLLTMLPRLVELVRDERRRSWGPFDVLDPFRTMSRIRDGVDLSGLWILLGVAALGFVLAIPSIVRGFAEVLDASRERRSRAS